MPCASQQGCIAQSVSPPTPRLRRTGRLTALTDKAGGFVVGEATEGHRYRGQPLESLFHQFFPALPDEADDEGGPAGLVGGTEAFARFAVEVFVEEDEVFPVLVVGIAFGDFGIAVAGALAAFVLFEEGDEAVADVDGDFPQGGFLSGAGGILVHFCSDN